jgi:hypothetical protein
METVEQQLLRLRVRLSTLELVITTMLARFGVEIASDVAHGFESASQARIASLLAFAERDETVNVNEQELKMQATRLRSLLAQMSDSQDPRPPDE